MSVLFTLQSALARTINADAVLCLAHAVAWLDPLLGESEDVDLSGTEEDTVLVALHILRRAFPDIYFDAMLAIRNGSTYQQLDHLICNAVQAQGIPLEQLEWMSYGIPLPTYGASLDDPEFYSNHADIIPILACFGIFPEPNPYRMVVPEITYKAADIIAEDLMKQADKRWHQVAWLVLWIFSSSNNSSVDFDLDTMESMQPLSWDVEDIHFACEIIQEADGILSDVIAAREWIHQNPIILEILRHNIHKIYQKKGKKNARYGFEWTCPAQCDERGTDSVA